jgi:hypothetical protein
MIQNLFENSILILGFKLFLLFNHCSSFQKPLLSSILKYETTHCFAMRAINDRNS